MSRLLSAFAIVLTVAFMPGCDTHHDVTSPTEEQPEAVSAITVTSEPLGATVFHNSIATGLLTPCVITGVYRGSNVVRLELDGFFANEEVAMVEDGGDSVNLHVVMTPAPTTIALTYGYALHDWRNGGLVTTSGVVFTGLDGKVIQRFADTPTTSYRIRWSPNGAYLAFANQYPGKSIDVVTSTGAPLTSLQQSDRPPWTIGTDFFWTVDGNQLLYSVYFRGIYRHDVSSGNDTLLVSNSRETYVHCPALSPDGRRLAYLHHAYGMYGQIHLRDDVTDVTLGPSLTTWLHDENIDLAWIGEDALLFKIYNQGVLCLTTDGTLQNVNSGIASLLRISPDGTRYAYVSNPDNPKLYVGMIGVWTTTEYDIPASYTLNHDLAWSPDNDAVAFMNDTGIWWTYLDGRQYHVVAFPHSHVDTSHSYGLTITRR